MGGSVYSNRQTTARYIPRRVKRDSQCPKSCNLGIQIKQKERDARGWSCSVHQHVPRYVHGRSSSPARGRWEESTRHSEGFCSCHGSINVSISAKANRCYNTRSEWSCSCSEEIPLLTRQMNHSLCASTISKRQPKSWPKRGLPSFMMSMLKIASTGIIIPVTIQLPSP